MKVSTKGRYALIIMIDIAKSNNEYTSLSDISNQENISVKYLEKIASSLKKAKLLETARGSDGGYKLTKKAEEYTVAEILNAAEGNIAPVKCVVDNGCPAKNNCKTYPFWKEFYDNEKDFLTKKTLKDIL